MDVSPTKLADVNRLSKEAHANAELIQKNKFCRQDSVQLADAVCKLAFALQYLTSN